MEGADMLVWSPSVREVIRPSKAYIFVVNLHWTSPNNISRRSNVESSLINHLALHAQINQLIHS